MSLVNEPDWDTVWVSVIPTVTVLTVLTPFPFVPVVESRRGELGVIHVSTLRSLLGRVPSPERDARLRSLFSLA